MLLKYGCLLLIIVGIGAAEETTSPPAPATGPTLQLDYTPEQLENPVDAFMYFVPLISLTAVSTEMDPDTTFSSGVINRQHRMLRRNRFVLTCDFEITGSGMYRVVYDPDEMIEQASGKETDKRVLTNLLNWIRFDGPCQGRIEANGTMRDGTAEVDTVTVSFNRNSRQSPVTIAIYDVPRIDGGYHFADRRNDTIARVNTLTFERGGDSPKMDVELASVHGQDSSEGLLSSIRAMFANWLLSALPISEVGNETMLDFGLALYHKEREFTFPIAETLRPSLQHGQASAF